MLDDLRRTSFFHDKNRAFWILQGGGWGAYLLLRALSGLANSMGVAFILPAVIVTATGFSLTLLMAAAYRRIIAMKPVYVWTLSLIILGGASALFSVLEVWAHATFYQPGWKPQGIEFLGAILLDFSVLGAWTGLYYGINYYLLLAEQSERMLNVAAQANAAQLEMLRYQLNPHFLFNTLNSISTLVLLKQTERANAMLSRLASFLRYSLVGEREGLATIAQEAEALKLYLDIERTRFESRLRTRFDVSDDIMEARLPSLLLQPIVENAIKYAVTQSEDGADILIDARRMSDGFAHRQPVAEIIADVITAEGQHRKRIATHFAHCTRRRRRCLGPHRGGLVHAFFPRARFADQWHSVRTSRAENERGDGHAGRIVPRRIK